MFCGFYIFFVWSFFNLLCLMCSINGSISIDPSLFSYILKASMVKLVDTVDSNLLSFDVLVRIRKEP